MKVKEAQEDMRKAYFGGGPGAFASGMVWLTAGITALISTKQISVMVFFFGGMLIHPIGIVLSKVLKRSGKLGLIADNSLKEKLFKWLQFIEDVKNQDSQYNTLIIKYLNNHISIKNIDTYDNKSIQTFRT